MSTISTDSSHKHLPVRSAYYVLDIVYTFGSRLLVFLLLLLTLLFIHEFTSLMFLVYGLSIVVLNYMEYRVKYIQIPQFLIFVGVILLFEQFSFPLYSYILPLLCLTLLFRRKIIPV